MFLGSVQSDADSAFPGYGGVLEGLSQETAVGGASRERGSEQRGTLGGGAVQGFEGESTLLRENNGKLHVIQSYMSENSFMYVYMYMYTCTVHSASNFIRSLKLLRITISPIKVIII